MGQIRACLTRNLVSKRTSKERRKMLSAVSECLTLIRAFESKIDFITASASKVVQGDESHECAILMFVPRITVSATRLNSDPRDISSTFSTPHSCKILIISHRLSHPKLYCIGRKVTSSLSECHSNVEMVSVFKTADFLKVTLNVLKHGHPKVHVCKKKKSIMSLRNG